MAAPRAPRSTSAASVACRSIGPGVVRFPASLGTGSPWGSNAPSVPIDPIGSSAESTWRSSVTDVVLPFVPVTPTRSSRAAGRPYHVSAARAAARRPSRTRICVRSTGCSRSTRAAAAPRSRASATNACPSWTDPVTAQYSTPGVTFRLSAVRPVISGQVCKSGDSTSTDPRSSAVTISASRLIAGAGGAPACGHGQAPRRIA